MFNIPLCTSDIFFCMKSDIYPVNILLLPLCTKKERKKRKHFILWPRKWCLGGISLQGLQSYWGGQGWGRATVPPTGWKGKHCKGRTCWFEVREKERERERAEQNEREWLKRARETDREGEVKKERETKWQREKEAGINVGNCSFCTHSNEQGGGFIICLFFPALIKPSSALPHLETWIQTLHFNQ